VHPLPDQGHLAKDRPRSDGGDDQLFAVGGDAVELHPTLLQQEQDFARVFGHVQDLAPTAGADRGRPVNLLDLSLGQVAEDIHHLQVTDFVRPFFGHASSWPCRQASSIGIILHFVL